MQLHYSVALWRESQCAMEGRATGDIAWVQNALQSSLHCRETAVQIRGSELLRANGNFSLEAPPSLVRATDQREHDPPDEGDPLLGLGGALEIRASVSLRGVCMGSLRW